MTPEEAKFAPVSLLDELTPNALAEMGQVQQATRGRCSECLGDWWDNHDLHCAGEVTDFDA